MRFGHRLGALDFAVRLGEVLEGSGARGLEVFLAFADTLEVHVAHRIFGALQALVPVLLEVAEADVFGRHLNGVGGRLGHRAPGTGLRAQDRL